MEGAPTQLYCLKCRKAQDVKPNTIHRTILTITTKTGKTHARNSWVAVCSVCEKPVRRFAKSDKKPEEPKPEAPVSEAVSVPVSVPVAVAAQ